MDNPQDIIEKLKTEIPSHFDDPNYLSKAVIDIARWTYWHNIQVAEAETKERQAMIDYKDEYPKAPIEECKNHAVVNTGNRYGLLKLDQVSNEHFMNGIKLRIRVLMGEKESSK